MPDELQSDLKIAAQAESAAQSQTPINSLPASQSKSKGCLFLIIGALVVVGSIFFLLLAAGPWSPLLVFLQKDEYTSNSVEGLEKEIPFYIKPDTKGWEYLKTAENFSGVESVVYYFKPVRGDISSTFGARLVFPFPLTKPEIVGKFDEALKKSNLEPQGVGLGQYCTKENYVIGIVAVDGSGQTIFNGFYTPLDDKGANSSRFVLGVDSNYNGNPKYADLLCKMLGESFISTWKTYTNSTFSFSIKHPTDWKETFDNQTVTLTWQFAKVKIFFGKIDLPQSKIEQKETIVINGTPVEFSYQFLADGSQVATGQFQSSKSNKTYIIQYSSNVAGRGGVGYESTDIAGLVLATIQKIIASISITQ